MLMARRLDIVKMLVPSKLGYRFETNPLRIPADYFVKIDNLNQNSYANVKNQE